MFGLGTTNSLTMDKPHPDSLLDTGVQGVIGKPLDRIDGPLKVIGHGDLCRGIPVRRTGVRRAGRREDRARARSSRSTSTRSKAMPGVIDVVTDFDQFIRVSAQGGETDAPTQGVKDIAFFGQIVAIVLAESFEVARDAAARLPIEYERGRGPVRLRRAPRRDARRRRTTRRPRISSRAMSTRRWPRRR